MNKQDLIDIETFIYEIHDNAKKHGWYDEKRTFGEIIALIHSELSEALEFERDKNNGMFMDGQIDYMYHYNGGGYVMPNRIEITNKPDGVLPELADVVIRVFDYVGSIDRVDDFIRALKEKHEYNKTRPIKHGGKTI